MRKVLSILILAGLCAAFARAQETPEAEDNQFWNDLQMTVPMTKEADFFIQMTARFDKNAARYNEGRFGIGFVLKPTKTFSVSPFYLNIQARGSNGKFRREHRLNLRATYRLPVRGFALAHRSGFEYRIRQPRNSWRYRPSLTFEKGIEKIIPGAQFFVTEEIFYDSQLKKFSRNRFTAGINKSLNKNLSLDVYYMRQNDGFSRPGDLNVIGTSWKVKL
jgi:Protein of unknown function (DUF2490).